MNATASPSTGYLVKAISYTIESSTTPGRFYTVSVNPLTRRPQSCNCPARKPCRHMRAVQEGTVTSKPRIRVAVRTQPMDPPTFANSLRLPDDTPPLRPRIGSAVASELYS